MSAEATIEALRTGSFYASEGPEIKDFRVEGRVASVKCSEAKQIRFYGPNRLGKVFFAKENEKLTEAKLKLAKDYRFVRAEVIDSNGKHAWTNPLKVENEKSKSF